MPRRNNIKDSDAQQRCPICFGIGQVENFSDIITNNNLMACPFCEGIGRVLPGGGNQKALDIYNKRKNQNIALRNRFKNNSPEGK